MPTTSILKELKANVPLRNEGKHSQATSQEPKVKQQFKAMQVKILNMFTTAKSELTHIYQKIVSKIKKIQKYLYSQDCKISNSFWVLLDDIQNQISQKTQNMSENMQKTVIDCFLYDQMLSLVPDWFVFATQKQLSTSTKKINTSSICSTRKFTQKGSDIVQDIDSIGQNEYKNAIKIKPNDKVIQNLGVISGKWDVLETIFLQAKQISRVIPFSTVIAETLQEINLSYNQITNMNFMVQAQYPLLRILNLKKNHINNLAGIERALLPQLKFLNFAENKIKKLDPLKKTNFQELIQLNLLGNKIQKADILTECDYPKLQVLNLDQNQLQNIQFISSCSFYRLKILSFCHNSIVKLDPLCKCKLQKLQALLAYNNKVQSINFLQHCDFPLLKQLILNNNYITDLSIVSKLNFKKLIEFDIENNRIEPEQVMCFTTRNDQCKKAKKKYPFIQL